MSTPETTTILPQLYAPGKMTLAPALSSRRIRKLRFVGTQILQQPPEVFRVFLFAGQNFFHDASARRIVLARIANNLAARVNGNAFGYEVFTNHVQEGISLHVFRVTPHQQVLRIEVPFAVELGDSFRIQFSMSLLF